MSFSGSLLSGTSLSGGQYYGAGLTVTGEWTPYQLFAAGEVGAWYDPSDLTTLYQDAAGTTPVTTPGQVVGRINDKSGRGNHAFQTGATSVRPIYAVEPATGRRNLLTYSEQFDNAAWPKSNVTVDASGIAAPDGTLSADMLLENTATSQHYIRQDISTLTNQTYTLSVYVKEGNTTTFAIQIVAIGSSSTTSSIGFSISGGVVIAGAPTGLVSSVTATSAGNGWYRCALVYTLNGTVTSHQARIFPRGNTGSYTGDGVSGIYVWGAQLETGTTATAYQRVVSQYDVSESGVASRHYLAFDGIDDWLQTDTITPGVDKVQVFTGVRKLSDAARGMLLETGNDAVGAFRFEAPNAAGTYLFTSRGTGGPAATYATTYNAPITNVVCGLGEISTDTATIRVNGAQIRTVATDQGAGNFTAQILYIGRRTGSTLPFNGHLYGAIVRFGPNLSASQISNTERWMNGKTGAY